MVEWFVAWRQLHTPWRPQKAIVLVVGAALAAAAVAVFVYAGKLPPPISEAAAQTLQRTQLAGVILGGLGFLFFWFGLFFQGMSFFTTISTFGVFLGVNALVIALSVMNGFESDLRQKILGSNAHILITQNEGSFTEYRKVGASVTGVCSAPRSPDCVVGWTPYLTSEVVVAANQNYGSTVIKGIDPATVAKVTELGRALGDPRSLERLWPLTPDGKPIPYDDPTREPPALDEVPDEEPPDFSGEGAPAPAGEDEEDEPVDFSQDAGVAVHTVTSSDRPLAPDPRLAGLDGILVGRELAKNLHLYTGQEVQIVSPLGKETPAGQVPRTRPFRVAGSFFTGMFEYDTKLAYVSLPSLQSFLSLGDEVTGIEVKVTNIDETGPMVVELSRRLGPGYRVQDWREINRNLFSALKLEKIAMFLVLTIIILVASFSIISNLIMVVVEKQRDISVLKSLGASDVTVMRLFIWQGLVIGAIGTSLGITTGVIAAWAMSEYGVPLDPNVYYIDRLPVSIDPFAVSLIAVAGVVISVLATLYPAYTSARIRPTDGLRK